MLEIVGLSKHFGDVRAVNGLDLTINPGEIFTMLGANGAGKTTPLMVSLGVTEPTSGLDPKSGAQFLQLLAELRAENKAIWMTTHDIFRAKAVADRVGIMSEGSLVKILTREELEEADLEKIYIDYVSRPANQVARVTPIPPCASSLPRRSYHRPFTLHAATPVRVWAECNPGNRPARRPAPGALRLPGGSAERRAQRAQRRSGHQQTRATTVQHKMELLRLTGRPIGTQVELEGESIPFPVDQEEAVSIALGRDVALAIGEEKLSEQRRVLAEVHWEYSPDLSVRAGVEDGRTDAKINVGRQAGTWGLDVESGYDLKEEEDTGPPRDDAQWSAEIEARIPIFEGGSGIGQKRRERARLEQVRDQFFSEQDDLFDDQANYINRQTELRRLMGFVE
jgi:hypothetical protein